MHRTAALLVVGNEILSGKIEDKNTHFLAKELFRLGIALRRVVVCVDEISTIAHEVNHLRRAHDYLFTSGGIGPTHDDVTIDAVAVAFEVPLDRDPKLSAAIEKHFGEGTTIHHLRMANVPRGATWVKGPAGTWPTLRMENVFVLPGVPSIFQAKWEGIRALLDHGERFHSHVVFIRGDEGAIAHPLERIQKDYPHVTIGSYIAPPGADYDVKLTFDAKIETDARGAADEFVSLIPSDTVLYREPRD